ncbi:MAG TPA: ribokinase [Chloroflexi bacterium]|nr:ribokinase [Chloroflexota bacterium]
MFSLTRLEPIDYLLIGHLSRDLTLDGDRLGGTVAYAALTAYALGLRVGLVTSWGNEFSLDPYLGSLPIINAPTEKSTTFENIETTQGRVQIIHNVAASLDPHLIPESWLDAPIIHLAPIAQEVQPSLVRNFPNSMIGITPQGWLREWDSNGRVGLTEWPEATFVLQHAGATVLSIEDIHHDEDRIDELASACKVLVVTEGEKGGRVYWNGDVRRYSASKVAAVDMVGAGDIFATAFFHRFHLTRDPWEATRFAADLAAISVTRSGMNSIPTPEEIQSATVEVL